MKDTVNRKTKTAAERQKDRDQRVKNAGLVQRKVVGHPDDFNAIREFAESLYIKRGIDLK